MILTLDANTVVGAFTVLGTIVSVNPDSSLLEVKKILKWGPQLPSSTDDKQQAEAVEEVFDVGEDNVDAGSFSGECWLVRACLCRLISVEDQPSPVKLQCLQVLANLTKTHPEFILPHWDESTELIKQGFEKDTESSVQFHIIKYFTNMNLGFSQSTGK